MYISKVYRVLEWVQTVWGLWCVRQADDFEWVSNCMGFVMCTAGGRLWVGVGSGADLACGITIHGPYHHRHLHRQPCCLPHRACLEGAWTQGASVFHILCWDIDLQASDSDFTGFILMWHTRGILGYIFRVIFSVITRFHQCKKTKKILHPQRDSNPRTTFTSSSSTPFTIEVTQIVFHWLSPWCRRWKICNPQQRAPRSWWMRPECLRLSCRTWAVSGRTHKEPRLYCSAVRRLFGRLHSEQHDDRWLYTLLGWTHYCEVVHIIRCIRKPNGLVYDGGRTLRSGHGVCRVLYVFF
jgi:hypothetical protein